jgi:hypothetical protein
MAQGADHDELPVPLLAEHLAQLRAGKAVDHPVTGASVLPRRHIVFETHFGRVHRATGSAIDLLLWIDTPPDVALARNLRSFLAPLAGLRDAAALHAEIGWIEGYLAHYEAVVARLLALQAQRVRPGADLVVGSGGAGIDQALEAIRAAAGPHSGINWK